MRKHEKKQSDFKASKGQSRCKLFPGTFLLQSMHSPFFQIPWGQAGNIQSSAFKRDSSLKGALAPAAPAKKTTQTLKNPKDPLENPWKTLKTHLETTEISWE